MATARSGEDGGCDLRGKMLHPCSRIALLPPLSLISHTARHTAIGIAAVALGTAGLDQPAQRRSVAVGEHPCSHSLTALHWGESDSAGWELRIHRSLRRRRHYGCRRRAVLGLRFRPCARGRACDDSCKGIEVQVATLLKVEGRQELGDGAGLTLALAGGVRWRAQGRGSCKGTVNGMGKGRC